MHVNMAAVTTVSCDSPPLHCFVAAYSFIIQSVQTSPKQRETAKRLWRSVLLPRLLCRGRGGLSPPACSQTNRILTLSPHDANYGWKSDCLLPLVPSFFLSAFHLDFFSMNMTKGEILTRRGASTGMPARCWERGPDVITSNRFCSLICDRTKHRDRVIRHQWLPCDSK